MYLSATGIVFVILTSGNSLARLGRLRDKYEKCLAIQWDYGSILKKCRLYEECKLHQDQTISVAMHMNVAKLAFRGDITY